MIIHILCSIHIFWCLFRNHIDNTLLRRWAILPSTIYYISYRLGLLGIFYVFVCSFFDPTFICTVIVLRCYIFSYLFPDFCIYLFHDTLWLTCYYLLILTYQFKGIFFSFIVLNYYSWSVAHYFSIKLDCNVPVSGSFFSLVFANFPINIITIFYPFFLYILSVLALVNRTLSSKLIQFFVRSVNKW